MFGYIIYSFWFHRTILLALKLILAGEVGPQKLPVPPSASMQLLGPTPPVPPQPVVMRTKSTAAEPSSSAKAHAEEESGSSSPTAVPTTPLPQVPSFTGTDMFSSAMAALIQRRQARRALQAQRNSRISVVVNDPERLQAELAAASSAIAPPAASSSTATATAGSGGGTAAASGGARDSSRRNSLMPQAGRRGSIADSAGAGGAGGGAPSQTYHRQRRNTLVPQSPIDDESLALNEEPVQDAKSEQLLESPKINVSECIMVRASHTP